MNATLWTIADDDYDTTTNSYGYDDEYAPSADPEDEVLQRPREEFEAFIEEDFAEIRASRRSNQPSGRMATGRIGRGAG